MSGTLCALPGCSAPVPLFPPSPVLPLRLATVSPAPTVALGQVLTQPLPVWPAKDPSEVADYALDFSPIAQMRTAVQADVSVSPAGAVQVLSTRLTGLAAILRLAGGTDGTTVQVSVTLALDDGERIAASATLPVVARSQAAPPAANTLTLNGLGVTVGGAPIPVASPVQQANFAGSAVTVGGAPLLLGGYP